VVVWASAAETIALAAASAQNNRVIDIFRLPDFCCSPKIADARCRQAKNRAALPGDLRRHVHVIMMTPNPADRKDGR
jgi:hypothetical protein